MHNHTIKTLLLGALLLASATAHAQYAWIDAKGVHHYSDQPPPADIPLSKIVKAPRGMAPSTPAEPVKAGPTLAEREADYRKRHEADDKSSQKAAVDAKAAASKQLACAAAAQNKAELDSGRRLRRQDGEQGNVILTEEAKAKEAAQVAAVLKDCKAP